MTSISKLERPGDKVSLRTLSGLIALVTTLLLGACASSPGVVAQPSPQPAPSPPSSEVYFYPAKGQSLEQQERDRYECYLWAREQTGFDPSSPNLAPHQRIVIEPAPPSSGGKAAVGAVTGAILGAIISSKGDRDKGMAVGAITGAMVGAASGAADQEKASEIQQQYDAREAQRMAELEQQTMRYRRAMSACLQGRGYTVR